MIPYTSKWFYIYYLVQSSSFLPTLHHCRTSTLTGLTFIAQLPTSSSAGESEWPLERQTWPCHSPTKFLWCFPISFGRTRVTIPQFLCHPPYSSCLNACILPSCTQHFSYFSELLTFLGHSKHFLSFQLMLNPSERETVIATDDRAAAECDTAGFGAGEILFLPLVLPSCLQGWVDMKITDNLCKELGKISACQVRDTNHQQILWLCL